MTTSAIIGHDGNKQQLNSELITAQRSWDWGIKQRTSEGIQCWSCQQGNYPGQNFGPEECQKHGKWIQCGRDEVSSVLFDGTFPFRHLMIPRI